MPTKLLAEYVSQSGGRVWMNYRHLSPARQAFGRTGVQYDQIYQCRRVTASAGDTEKQSATLDKYSDTTRVDRVLSALAVQNVRSV